MRPVEAERPISLPTLAGVLLLAAGMTALLTGAFAQEGLPRLRGVEDGRTPSAGARRRSQFAPGVRRFGRKRRSRPATCAAASAVRAGPGGAASRPPPRCEAPSAPPCSRRTSRATCSRIQVGVPDPAAPGLARRRRRPVEEDPYSQLGLRLGGLTVLPAIQQSIGYDTNPNRSGSFHKSSTVFRTDGEVRLQSDWSAHALTGAMRGSYSEYPNIKGANRPEGEGRLGLRLDVSRDTQVDVEGRFQLDTQRPGSPDLNAAVTERPLVTTTGAAAGVTQRFNRLLVGLRGTVDRTVYEDAQLTNGTILDQSDRDSNQYGLRLRVGYELTPGVIPFVDVLADRRECTTSESTTPASAAAPTARRAGGLDLRDHAHAHRRGLGRHAAAQLRGPAPARPARPARRRRADLVGDAADDGASAGSELDRRNDASRIRTAP